MQKQLLLLILICLFSCKHNSEQTNVNNNKKNDSLTLETNKKITDSLLLIVRNNNYLNTTKSKIGYKKVVHFGNSICKHPIIANIWWGKWGMAATVKENDYVHRFLNMLKAKNPLATSDALNIAPWETDYTTFDKSTLDPYLKDKDLVVLRLGENVKYYPDFQNQYKKLVQYIQLKSPNATIVLGGQFWTNATKENAMINVAIELGLPFVSLNHLDSPTYKQNVNNIVYGDDDLTHIISNAGVANHPNDLGMLRIAESLFTAIDFKAEISKTTPTKKTQITF